MYDLSCRIVFSFTLAVLGDLDEDTMCGTDLRIDSKACFGLSLNDDVIVFSWWCGGGDTRWGLELPDLMDWVSLIIAGDSLYLDLLVDSRPIWD